MPGIAEYEIPRDLRDQREEKQVLSVFAAVPRVKEALNQKKTEDREGRSADITDDTVPGDLCGTNGKEHPEGRFPVGEDQNAGVVDQHQDTGKKFQGTAA